MKSDSVGGVADYAGPGAADGGRTCKLGTGRAALTDWKVLRRFEEHAGGGEDRHGRTHQIRVHLSSLGIRPGRSAVWGAGVEAFAGAVLSARGAAAGL